MSAAPKNYLKVIEDILQTQGKGLDKTHLQTGIKVLEKLAKTAPQKWQAALMNALGLSYRRLGERGDARLLHKAINFLERAQRKNVSQSLIVEMSNNIAISHIRLFELGEGSTHLDIAEKKLKECLLIMEKDQELRDTTNVLLRPNVFNNLGNVWKERSLFSQDKGAILEALRYYRLAERQWTKKDFSYFWATVQKNKAESKYILSTLTKDGEYVTSGLRDVFASMKYRDVKNAPYQWAKSASIALDLFLLIPRRLAREKKLAEKMKAIVATAVAIVNFRYYEDQKAFMVKVRQVQKYLLLV